MKSWLRSHGTALPDLLGAAGLFVVLLIETALSPAIQQPWIDVAWIVPFAGALAFVRLRTAPAAATVMVAAVGMTITGDNIVDYASAFIVVMIVAFAVGFELSARRATEFLVAIIGVVVFVDLNGKGQTPGDYIFPAGILAAWWTLGRFLRARHRLTSELRRRTERLERERDELARAASDEERARVARELHDVVAHSMSVMVVQAGAARHVLERSPERSIEALRIVETTGRETLEELRRLLGALRPSDAGPELSPAPRISDLGALVNRARATGLKVDLQVTGDDVPLPATTDLTLYRIVQEALTNSLKHAGETHASVALVQTDEHVDVDVRDTGRPPGSPPPEAADHEGFGLVGMRERVELLGGELDAGPTRSGGFRVHARIPLDPDGESAATAGRIVSA